MGSAPFVSVIMSCFNERAWLEQSIPSILAQTYERMELLVLNDASTDDTASYLQSINDPRFRVFEHAQRHGLAANLNRLASEAKGELLKVMCPDDLLVPESVSAHAAVYNRNSEMGCMISGCDHIDPAGHGIGRSSPWPSELVLSPADSDRFTLQHGGIVNLSTLAVRKDAWLAIGGARQSKSLDFNLVTRLQELYPLVLVPASLVKIRMHPGQWGQDMSSAWENVESDMATIASVAQRAKRAGQLSENEFTNRLADYTARTHFLTVLHFLTRGSLSEAMKIARIIQRVVPLRPVATAWFAAFVRRRLARARAKLGLTLKMF